MTMDVWSATLTVGLSGSTRAGYCVEASGRCSTTDTTSPEYGSLSDDDFELDSVTYTVESLRWASGSNSDSLHLTLDKDLPDADLASLTLQVGSYSFALSDATRGNSNDDVDNNYSWRNVIDEIDTPDLYQPDSGDTHTVKILKTTPASCPATAPSDQVWCGVVTVGSDSDDSSKAEGYCDSAAGPPCDGNSGKDPYGSLDDNDFVLDSETYTIESLRWASQTTGNIHLTLDKDIDSGIDLTSLTLKVGGADFVFDDATQGNNLASIDNNYRWSSFPQALFDLEDNDTVFARIVQETTTTNNAPDFGATSATRSFDETIGNATVSTAANIGTAVAASDDDNDTLIYTLEGTDAAKFGIVSTSGQIQTKVGERYSHEAASSYTVTVKADDSNGGTDTIEVTINVDDVAEPPQKPVPPTVNLNNSSATSLFISWTAPGNAGRPAFSGFRLQYRKDGTNNAWMGMNFGSGGGFEVTNLDVAVDYEFQIRWSNAEGDGPWSDSRVASTASLARPVKPAAPTVSATSGSTTSLDVAWTEPDNGTRPAITSYDLQYKKSTDTTWTNGPQNETDTSAAITGLDASTSYDVQVRAQNTNGHSGWSDSGTGSTGTPANNAPAFDDATLSRSIAENTAANSNVGAVIPAATDDDNDTLTYSMEGTDAGSFDFDASARQIKTKSGVSYDFEAKSTYTVTIKADDSNGGTDTVEVVVTLTDVAEPPAAPAAPTVTATSGSDTSLDVSWTAPANVGKPTIDNYDLQYKKSTDANWTAGPQDVTGTSTAISGLEENTSYDVQVRATNDEGDSPWSGSGTGSTSLPPNLPASGDVTISGAPQTGQTLEVSVSNVTDGNGTEDATYAYQWFTVDGGTTSNITGQMGTTYTVASSDEGKVLGATVSFTDDQGYAEALPATALPAVVPAADACPSTVPDDQVWCTVLTSGGRDDGKANIGFFFGDYGSLGSDSFEHLGTNYDITRFDVANGATAAVRGSLYFATASPYLPTDGAGLTLHIQTDSGETALALADNDNVGGGIFRFDVAGATSGLLLHSGTSDATDATADGIRIRMRLTRLPAASFGAASYTATEGGSDAEVVVNLDPAPSAQVVIPITKTNQGGAADADYSGVPASVTFAANAASATFTVTATDDSDDDDGESVKLAFGTLPPGVIAGGTTETTVNLTDNDGSGVTVSFGSSTYTATEGGTAAVVAVALSSALTVEAVVPIEETLQGGATAGDYSGVASNLTFAAGDTDKTFTVTATDDARDEGAESVKLSFGTLPPGVIAGSTTETTVTLADNDDPPVLNVGHGSGTEGIPLNFTVAMVASGREVTVDYATSVATGDTASSEDFTTQSGTLTFDPGQTQKTVEVPTAGDMLDEENETFTLTLSNASNATLGIAVATGTINDDDDPPALDFEDASATEGDPVNFEVTLSPASGKTVEVTYTPLLEAGDMAVIGTDLPANQGGTLTFAPGETTKTVPISTTEDTLDEENETFTFWLSVPVNATLPADATRTGTIIDDDDPPTVDSDDADAQEGDPVNFTVTLTAASGRTVTVDYATSVAATDTASADDFTDTSGTLTFDPGEMTMTVSVPTTEDDTSEDDETFTLTLSNAVNAELDVDTTHFGVIFNDDAAGTVSVSDANATEGSPMTFTATLSVASGLTVTVNYATSVLTGNTAVSGTDFTATSGILTFAPGDTEETVTVPTTADIIDEDDETFTLRLSTAVNATLADPTATGTILDDDGPPSASFTDASGTEGDSVEFAVTLSAASGKEVTVDYNSLQRLSDTAIVGTDYTGTSGALTFAPGETTMTVAVQTTEDTIDEDDETFAMQLADPVNVTLSVFDRTGTITDDDPEPTLALMPAIGAEGEAIEFTVTMAESGKTVTVDYATSLATGDTASADDFTAANGTLTFAPGDTTMTVSVQTTEDDTNEANETFTLTLSNADNASLPSPASVRGRIDNDDAEGTLSVSDASATEGGLVTFTVTQPASGLMVTVSYVTAAGTATGADFTAANGTLTFAAGDTEKTVTVQTTADTLDEDNETFTLTLLSASNAMLPSDATVTGTILDDDDPPVLGFNDASATEGDPVNFTVTLTVASGKTVTVAYGTSANPPQTAIQGTDFPETSGTLTFAPGETTKTAAVPTTEDSIDEEDETFTMALHSESNATLPSGSNNTRTGTILDDDAAPVLSLAVDDNAINEGDASLAAVLTASISGSQYAADQAVTLEFTGTATQGASADYTVSGTSLTLDGETTGASATATVTVINDDVDEAIDMETIIATLKLDGTAVDSVTITVTDDDVRNLIVHGLPVEIAETDADATDTYAVELNTEPTANVTVTLSVDGDNALTTVPAVSPTVLTFTPSDWDDRQTVTVTAAPDNDAVDESAQVRHAVSSSGDYGSTENADVAVTVDDDETASTSAALSVDQSSVAEGAGATQVEVMAMLNAGAFKTARTVTVTLAPGPDTEASDYTAPGSLTLTLAAQADSATATFTLTPDNDALWEPEGETVRLTGTVSPALSGGVTPVLVGLTDDDAEPMLEFTATATEMAETGGSVELVARIANGVGFEAAQTVNLDFSASNATAGADYTQSPSGNTLTLAAGAVSASATLTLTAVDDALDEDDGTAGVDAQDERIRVTATHSPVPSGSNELAQERVVAILDDDHPQVTVQFTDTGYTPDEGETQGIAVGITVPPGNAGPERELVIPITHTPTGGATPQGQAGEDYRDVPASVTFAATGTTPQRFLVPVTDDAIDDDGEGVTLGFGALPDAQVSAGSPSTATLAFGDDDERGLRFEPPTQSLTEAAEGAYTVALTSEPTANVTVTLSVDALMRLRGGQPDELVFTPSDWATEQTVKIQPFSDADAATEDSLIGHAASGGDYGANNVSATYTVTVIDLTDPATGILLEVSPVSVSEGGGAQTVTVTARLNGAALSDATTVAVTLSDGSASSSDYTASPDSFTLTIAAQAPSAAQTVTVTVTDDAEDEGAETISVAASATGGVTATADPATITIEDNDVRGVTVSESLLELAEGGSDTYTVALDTAPSGSVTVTPVSGHPSVTVAPAEVVFTATDYGAKTLTVTAEQDNDASNVTTTVTHAVSGADYGGVAADAVEVLVDDDEEGSSGVLLEFDPAEVDEGAGETQVEVTASLDGGALLDPVTVNARLAAGSATAADYQLDRSQLSLTIPAGTLAVTATVTLTPVDDGVDEENDRETVELTGTASNGFPVTGDTLAIVDDDVRGVTVAPITLNLQEGGAPGTYTVALDSEPTGSVTVELTTSGPAEAPVRVSPQVLVFTASDHGAKTVTVQVRGDRDLAGGTVTVSHAVSGADYAPETAGDVTVDVTDGVETLFDVQLTVSGNLSFSEADGPQALTATATLLTGTRLEAVSVTVEVSGVDAEASDFRASPARFTLSIPAGATEASRDLTVTPVDDGIDEDDERLVIAPSVADHLLTNEAGVELTITDDDTRGVTVAPVALSLMEGASGSYTVSLGSQPEASVTVAVTVSGSDSVTASPSELVFTPSNWRGARRVTVRAEQDPGPNDENATLSHAVSGGDYGANNITAANVSVTVTDDDKPSEAVRLTVTPDTVSEGAGETTLTVTGTLDASARTDEMTVSVTIPPGAGYTAVDAELTIAAGQTSGTARLMLTPQDDNVDADDIAVTIEASTAAQATLTDATVQPMRLENADGSALALTVTITDDDERGVTVAPTALEVREGEAETYTVVLRSEPDGGAVEVTLTLADDVLTIETGASVAPASLTFQGSDWNVMQTVTVEVPVDDMNVELDATATVTHEATGSDYGAVAIAAVTVTVPGFEEMMDEATGQTVVQMLVSPDGSVTVPGGTAAPEGLHLELPAAHGANTISVRSISDELSAEDQPNGFREGDVAVDIELVGTTLSGETVVCLPTEERGRRVYHYDESADPPDWVELPVPESGSPDGLACGVTESFSRFALGAVPGGEAKSWLARFGRTVATHIVDAIGSRLAAPRVEQAQLSLGGSNPQAALLGGVFRMLSGEAEVDAKQALANSSFVLPLSEGGAQRWTAWGRGAYTEFEGEEAGVDLDGEVVTGTVGVDLQRGDWLAGVALSHSEGDGDSKSADGDRGEMEISLTSVSPYARLELEGGLTVWGVAGYGEGDLERTRDGDASEVDLEMRMVAAGAEGPVGEIETEAGTFELTLKADALAVRMEADAEEDLPEVEADAQRLRLRLSGSGQVPLESGGTMFPMLEAGLRFDEGDAETGLGLEVGAGFRYADASGRLSAELNARVLAAHEESGYDEWGVGGSLVLRPDHNGRGLSLKLGSAYGATQSGTGELWSRENLAGISENQDVAPGTRFEAELGYGLNAVEGRGVLTPYTGYRRQGDENAWRLGSRLTLGNNLELDFESAWGRGSGEDDGHQLKLGVSGRW